MEIIPEPRRGHQLFSVLVRFSNLFFFCNFLSVLWQIKGIVLLCWRVFTASQQTLLQRFLPHRAGINVGLYLGI